MTDEQVKQLVNHFCKMMLAIDYSPKVVEELKIALESSDDGYSLMTIPKEQKVRRGDYAAVLDFPPNMPEDPTDAAIDLAGYLTMRLKSYSRVVKANSGRSKAAKRQSARKAAEARWRRRQEG